mmetsp:Transcript_31445/g.86478  ORF Transcript_31445/g.86478 Transcript_31445/m.86478 type:complete len:360 (-) Transcript_31445:28-1107(-)
MIAASFPPSSSKIRLKSFAQAAMTLLPTAVDPVNTTFRTNGCPVRNSPGNMPGPSSPTITFKTPGGNNGRSNSPIRRVVSGVCGAGFRTTVLPQAKALDVGFQPRTMGAFHGAIIATTPMGERRSTTRLKSSSDMYSSLSMSSSFPAASKFAAATRISRRVSARGLPLSFVCSVARGCRCSRNLAAQAESAARLSDLGKFLQEGAARSAARTAASSCSSDTCGASPTKFPVAGLRTLKVFAERWILPSISNGARLLNSPSDTSNSHPSSKICGCANRHVRDKRRRRRRDKRTDVNKTAASATVPVVTRKSDNKGPGRVPASACKNGLRPVAGDPLNPSCADDGNHERIKLSIGPLEDTR